MTLIYKPTGMVVMGSGLGLAPRYNIYGVRFIVRGEGVCLD